MRSLRCRVQSTLALVTLFTPILATAQTSGCYSSTTDDPAVLLRMFARFSVAATDSVAVASRSLLGIPAVDSTKVVLTTDSRTCTSIVAAINRYENTPGMARLVQVANLAKSGFMAYDGSSPAVIPPPFVRPVYNITKQFVVRNVLLGL
jgi:hypothetical protein